MPIMVLFVSCYGVDFRAICALNVRFCSVVRFGLLIGHLNGHSYSLRFPCDPFVKYF